MKVWFRVRAWAVLCWRMLGRSVLPWLSMRRWYNRFLLVTASLLVGLMCILFAVGADAMIAWQGDWVRASRWWSLLITPLGFAAVVWCAHRFAPMTMGSGIPQALAAMMSDDKRVRERLLSLKIAWMKIVLTWGGLLVGAATGREGPSVQVGASALHALSGFKHKRRVLSNQDLIAVGGGAGIAAAFNTPLGGILFAIEEMCRFRAFKANGATLTGVIFTGLISLGVLGPYAYFGRVAEHLDWSASLGPTLVCGVCGGLLGGLFSRLLVRCSHGLPGRVGRLWQQRPVCFAALCGLGTAILGIATNGLTYGTGYAETKAALEGASALPWFYFLAKLGAVLLAFLSRIPGGMFAPALAVGAGLGADVAQFFPATPASAVLILGMVAFLTGMTQTPITAFVIVMEMTSSHGVLIPLMGAAVIAQAVSRPICPTPLYHALSYSMLRTVQNTLAREDAKDAPPPAASAPAVIVATPALPAAPPEAGKEASTQTPATPAQGG